MQVTIVGPNLPAEFGGTFVVHAADCMDLSKLQRYLGGDTWSDTIEADSMIACAEFVYPKGEFEYWDVDPDGYIDDLKFYPCVQRELPRRDPSG